MKKLFSLAASVCLSGSLFAGGLVTNTNQSASFTRMQCRDATLGIDAVYYNPAGLTKLSDGFHLSLNNQSIFQTQTIISSYSLIKGQPKTYQGDVSAPLFPGVYAAYKTGKLAFSFGFNPIGGGGGAEYKSGLPSFETKIPEVLASALVGLDAGLSGPLGANPNYNNVTSNTQDMYFKGSSIYFGYQANVSYAINDMISIAVGARYVSAKNTYTGYLENINISAAPNASVPGLAGLAGNYTPGDYLRAVAATPYPAMAGPTVVPTLVGTAAVLDATVIEADVIETGSGITPVVSVNIAPSEKLNIALKYELKTKLELTTEVIDAKNAAGLWTDKGKRIADMPAQLVAGFTYKPMEKLLVSTGIHYYFDKDVDYDGNDTIDNIMIDKNFIEYALGLQYSVSEKLNLSAGWLTTITGVNDAYQDDLSYSLNTNTFGGGLEYRINDMIAVNLAGSYTMYKDGSVPMTKTVGTAPASESYSYDLSLDKKVIMFSVGLDFSF